MKRLNWLIPIFLSIGIMVLGLGNLYTQQRIELLEKRVWDLESLLKIRDAKSELSDRLKSLRTNKVKPVILQAPKPKKPKYQEAPSEVIG
jgi:hypothetical protein